MANNFNDIKEKLKRAVIDANVLHKLEKWLLDICNNNNKDFLQPETVLFYIDETRTYITKLRKEQENGKQRS